MYVLPSVVLGLPFVGVLFLLFVRGSERVVSKNSRHVALLITVSVFFLSLLSLAAGGDISPIRADWRTDVDALSMFFVLLISFVTVLAVGIVRRHVPFGVREFCFLALTAEGFMLTAVCARDLWRFFALWEAAAVPLFLMVAVWGAEKRVFTAYKFFFSDLAGALCLMPAMCYLANKAGATDFSSVAKVALSAREQTGLAVAFIAALAFKAPLFPFHAWLGETQAESPAPTGILLCGAFSKLTFYAFFRLVLPVTGAVLQPAAPYLIGWAAFSALYGALVALKQTEIKKIAGFAHLTQVGFLTAGLFCLSVVALKSLLFLCAAQGLALTAYLMAAGALQARFKAAQIRNPTGVMSLYPYLGTTFFLSCLAVLAVPPLMPFTGQVLIFDAVFSHFAMAGAMLLVSSALLYAAFFRLFTRLMFGEAENQPVVEDMSWREKTAAVLFGAVFVMLSVVPDFVFSLAQKAVGG